MTLDSDLQAIQHKIDGQSGEAFSREERLLVNQLLSRSQQHRDRDTGARFEDRRRELDFFMVCLGTCVLVFSVLVLLRWITGTASMDEAGALGLAFLASVSVAVLRAEYPQPSATPGTTSRVKAVIAGLVLILSLIGLMAAGGIGPVIGIVLGAVFFQSWMRYRATSRIQNTENESAA